MADRMTGQWEVMDIPHRPDDDLVVSITRDLQRKLGPIPPNHKIKMENSFDHERQVHILRARAEPCEPWERENETVVVAGKASGEERMTTRIDGPGLEAEYTVTDESGPLTNEQMAAIFSGAYQDTLKVTEGYYSGKYDTPQSWKDRLTPSAATK